MTLEPDVVADAVSLAEELGVDPSALASELLRAALLERRMVLRGRLRPIVGGREE